MTPDEKELRDTIAAWDRASEADDRATLGSLVADDVVFLAAGREPVVGREKWVASYAPRMPGVQHRSEIAQVVVYGGLAHAWCEIVHSIPAGEGEAEIRVEGYTLTMYRKGADGKWLLAKEATLLAPARPR